MNFFRYNRVIDCVWLCNCRAACGTRKTGLRKDGGKNMTGICFDIDDTLYSRGALLIQAAEETLRRTDGFIMSDETSFSGEVFLKIFYEKSDENFALVESGAITARESNIWRLQQTFLTMGLPTESWQGAYFTDRYTQLQNQIMLSPIMRKLLEDLAKRGIRPSVEEIPAARAGTLHPEGICDRLRGRRNVQAGSRHFPRGGRCDRSAARRPLACRRFPEARHRRRSCCGMAYDLDEQKRRQSAVRRCRHHRPQRGGACSRPPAAGTV